MIRKLYFLSFLVSSVALCAALLMEHLLEADPCPLCLLSRAIILLLAIFSVVPLLHNPQKQRTRMIYSGIASLFALSGIMISLRHIWIQNLPPEKVPACGPGIDYLLKVLPPSEVLTHIFNGSGECADVQVQFLGASLPVWTLGLFIFILGLWIFSGIKKG